MTRLAGWSLLLSGLACLSHAKGCNGMVDDFEKIAPSADLAWTPCFDNFTCARLEVPLDYSDKSLGTTSIAFIKLAAQNATDDTPSLVFIPGGPGGSGIELVRSEIARASVIFGDQLNIVSFDPRGVANSGPNLDCFSGNKEARAEFTRLHATGAANVSSSLLLNQYYSSSIYGDWCNNAVDKDTPKAYHVTTPAVAHDLLTFTEAEAKLAGKSPSDAKLWAYGVSYGTVIGTTFASMFPDRVGRLILDGLLNADAYYDNDHRRNVGQMDEGMEEFAKLCHSAGPDKCAFWGPSEADIMGRIDKIMYQLQSEPVPVSGIDSDGLLTLVTVSDLKALFLTSLYAPLARFPFMAETLHQVENSNVSALVGLYKSLDTIFDAGLAVQCTDSYRRNKVRTLEHLKSFVEYTTSHSRYIGDLFPIYMESILCRSFEPQLSEGMTFKGKVGADKTSFPILFTSNTIDPVTPLTMAQEMAERFPGSKLLLQEAIGHTVLDQGASPCYLAHIQAYLQGEVPEGSTTCPRASTPFLS